jgi:hypothetical protein
MVLEEANKLTGPPNFTRWNMILVVVNSDHYGGYCSGDIAWTYKSAADAGLMAQHELAHVFGLFDEYENLCDENDPLGPDPLDELNISSDPAAPRWKKKNETIQIYPKTDSDHCLGADGGDDGSIGSFQGGNHTHLAYYRPAFRCRMRDLEDAFCGVCKKHLETSLYPLPVQTG